MTQLHHHQTNNPHKDHIDPKNGVLVCGLDVELNLITTNQFYNHSKQNRFVPYKVGLFPSPRLFGDMCEFLIDGEWVVCEFGGKLWWEQSSKNGCGCNHSNRGYKTGKLTKQTVDEMRQRGHTQGLVNIKTGHMKRMQTKGVRCVRKPVLVTRVSDGHVFLCMSRSDVCKQFHLHPTLVIECLNGKRGEYKGYLLENFDGEV